MQFNILADGLAARDREKQGGFKDCPIDALRWPEYRRDRVLEEILRHGNFPDVVALEEVDHFYDDLSPAMEELGYRGVYKKKPDSPCKEQSGDPNLEDGCALFWRRETFEEVVDEAASVWYVNYDEVDDAGAPTGGKANQVGIIAHLRVRGAKGGGALFGVTHLKAAKKARGERERAAQIQQFLDFATTVQQRVAGSAANAAVPVILGMDMNASPPGQHMPYPAEAVPVAMAHPLGLRSAYAVANGGAEPAWSTWKKRAAGEVKHTIDYILASPAVGVRKVLRVPDDDLVIASGLLPSFSYPSDHMALAAELELPAAAAAP